MAYNIQKLNGYLHRYQAVQNTNNLEVCVRTMLFGVTTNSKFDLDGKIKSMLFLGGKTKSRLPLKDKSVTSVVTPKTSSDEDIYIDSIIEVINRYLGSINLSTSTSQNKVKSLLVRLLSNNVTGFYNRLNLPKVYLDMLSCIFSNLIKASDECVIRFRDSITSSEYLLNKLPARFEFKSFKPNELWNEYFSDFNCDELKTESEISEFMESIKDSDDESENEDSESSDDTKDELEEMKYSESEIIDMIPEIIEKIGWRKVIAHPRPDKLVAQKFVKITDPKIKQNLFKIVGGFHSAYIRLTSSVWGDTYKSMLNIKHSTYKENIGKVVKEIYNYSSSDEFNQFKKILLES